MRKKDTIIVVVVVSICAVLTAMVMLFAVSLPVISYLSSKVEETTDRTKYNDVIGKEAKDVYRNKWGFDESIFPSTIKGLEGVKDFKMVYYNPWDAQYLAYLVVDYNKDDYQKEVERLTSFGISEYEGFYGVSGFTNYRLLAMNADDYNGFIYAITDDNNRIIYVEIIFCNYFMDLDYEKYIDTKYLPDGFNAKEGNPYRKIKMNER